CFLFISGYDDGGGFARMSRARTVAEQGTWLPTGVWLRCVCWILAVFCRLGISRQFGLRMVTAVAGAATVPALFLLVRRLYDEQKALVASAVLCLNPLHVRFSILTVSEAFFILLLTVALLAFDRHQERGDILSLAAGGVAMNLACGMRLEGWLFLPALLAWVPLKNRGGGLQTRLGRATLFLSLSTLFSVGWMVHSLWKHGDPLHVATLTR